MKLLAAAPDSIDKVFGTINKPTQIAHWGPGAVGLSYFLTRIVQVIYVVAALLVLFMFLTSALQWITSGGDKDAVASARKRMTSAIIGLILLAITFFFLGVFGKFTGFSFFNNAPTTIQLPS